MAKVSVETRHKVVSLRQQGLSQVEIARQTGVSRCAVQALLQKHKETGTVEDQKRSGRPRKLSKADERLIKLTLLRDRKMSSSAITSELAVTSGTLVHPSTVRRSLARSGLHGRRGGIKQVLKPISRAQIHENWDDNEWEQEVWIEDSEAEISDSNTEVGEPRG